MATGSLDLQAGGTGLKYLGLGTLAGAAMGHLDIQAIDWQLGSSTLAWVPRLGAAGKS